MQTLGHRDYIDIPGGQVHDLPPLLLKDTRPSKSLHDVIAVAQQMIDRDAIIDDQHSDSLEDRRVGLAINLAEHYSAFLEHWYWGESISEWIRQCETTFQSRPNLRPLLSPDIWPHASRASFVRLLEDKRVPHGNIDLENAMGYRLTFRQPPPIQFFSEKYLFFLNTSLAASAFEAWARTSGDKAASLPPERFRFFVTGTEIREV
jgi:hypothetical protein